MSHFIDQIIEAALEESPGLKVTTRFPPEPNGHLHIGHAKSICLNFGMAEVYGGKCFMRFDDTNPLKESAEYVTAIMTDVRWLGFDWDNRLTHASDYFESLYAWAVELIRNRKAYVCALNSEEMRISRGSLTQPGSNSPYRDRSVTENLDLFARMRSGEFPDGAHVLRAKIDMSSPNMNLRDPTLYRIRHQPHQRTDSEWCIYPMYDYTHALSDALEGITHSLCTLEFEDHRPLYDWVLDHTTAPCHPQQIEFSRLELDYTVMSKRILTQLVNAGAVDGWDDPRMPTLAGMRRRGYPPAAIRDFCNRIGVTKKNQRIEMSVLEQCVRESLEPTTPRALGVLRPIKLIIDNYPDGVFEAFDIPNHPSDPSAGSRKVMFGREIYIDEADFLEDPPRRFFRLSPGREVRLRYAYYVTCVGVDRDSNGDISTIHCTYDPDSRGGGTPDKRKVKGTLHWVSAAHALPAQARLYEPLFGSSSPLEDPNVELTDQLNATSRTVIQNAQLESSLQHASVGTRVQLERIGYFCVDPDTQQDQLVLNQIVALRDSLPREKPS